MNFRLVIATVVFSLPIFSCAQETSSRLRFTPPENWGSSVHPVSHLATIAPPGGNASVSFTPSTAFTSTAEAWQHDMWSGILESMKLAGPSQPGVQAGFLTRMGVFNQPDGSKPWVCLYTLVQDGRGEGAIFFAANEKEFFAYLGVVNRMMQRATIAPITPAASPPATSTASQSSPPATASGNRDAGVAGLYLATTRQLRFNPLGGSGSADWEVRTEFYLLSRDGRVFRGRDLPSVPGGDISRFDYAAAQREAPGNYGTYVVRGNQVELRVGNAPVETLTATLTEAGLLEIRGTKFRRSGTGGSSSASSPSSTPAASAASATATAPLANAAAAKPSAGGPENSVPVLAYSEPAGFYRGASTSPVEYSSNSVNAGIQVYPFRPFSGDLATTFKQTLLRDWIDPRYRGGQIAGPPEFVQYRILGATQAFVAAFQENVAGTPGIRTRMLVLVDNQAAIVDCSANSAASWQQASPAMRAMLDSLRVEQKAGAPSMTAGPGPGGAAVVGLWAGSKSKYVVNLQRGVGSGDTKLALHYYLFSADGRVYCCYDFPPGPNGDWRRFDFNAAQRDDPANTGRFTVEGSTLYLRMSDPASAPIAVALRDPSTLEIQTIKYARDR